MLIQFNFENYKSFRDDTSLDLSATKITEHPYHIANIGEEKLLKLALIYGANASGKSNIYDAFKFMSIYVSRSLAFGGTSNSKKKEETMTVRPFVFDEVSKNEKTIFEVFFIDKSDRHLKTYQYGFAIKGSKICEEWLYSKAKKAHDLNTIFYRNIEERVLELDGLGAVAAKSIKAALEEETLIVSLGAKLRIAKLKPVFNWFLNNEIADFSDPVEHLWRSNQLPEGFDNEIEVQKKVVEFFHSFDESIIGFDVEKVVADSDGSERYRVYAKHKMIGSNEIAYIPLQEESKGTLEMFSLFPFIQNVLSKGSVLFIDELNAKLHPLLVRNIILTFSNPETNPNDAQLLFTTHDSWQLSNDTLRRDEIWFVQKDEKGVSHLYSLVEFKDEEGVKIRKDENYTRNYLLGKYGAIPSLRPITLGGDNFEEK